MPDSLLLGLGMISSVLAMGWLALGMKPHWEQACGEVASSAHRPRILRVLGTAALAASLALCLTSDHVSIASLVWVMSLAASILVVALVLAWRPRCLVWLVPWTLYYRK